MSLILEFSDLTKSFEKTNERPLTIKELLINLITFNFIKNQQDQKVSTVLSDFNLRVYKNDFVGIMGRNGVGKSTLLKLISQIYTPTSGSAKSYGSIVPLLELGAGFAPELNGYENIYLNSSILGFEKKEIDLLFDSIVNFSELGDHLERPVRNFSSGMLVRLGFSIAAHLNADILLFDEILAVGDAGFQKKCVDKIMDLHKKGKTIILVTHSPEQVESYCNRCVIIDAGKIIFDGDVNNGADTYRKLF